MEKKVFIFGDSYADPKGCPSYAWHNLLKEKYIVCNYGETGTGPQYSFDRFYDLELQSDDTVVFLLSDPHRINFYGGSLLKGELSHIVWDEKSKKSYCVFEKYSDNMLTSRHMKILDYHKKHKDQIDFLFLTQERELLNSSAKNISFLHSKSKEYGLKIIVFEIFKSDRQDMSYLNNDIFHLYPDFLSIKSLNEIYEDELQLFDRHSDKRCNHFSEENHYIFYEYINNFMNNITWFPEFKQHFRHCEDVYDSKKFIYE